jgi:hypothetical protein
MSCARSLRSAFRQGNPRFVGSLPHSLPYAVRVGGQVFTKGPKRGEVRLWFVLSRDPELLELTGIVLYQCGDWSFGGQWRGREPGKGSSRVQGSIPTSIMNCLSPSVMQFPTVMTYIGRLDPLRGFLREKTLTDPFGWGGNSSPMHRPGKPSVPD